jgi:subtilase family serine protease
MSRIVHLSSISPVVSSATRRRLATVAALTILLSLALSACSVRVADNPSTTPNAPSDTTPGPGGCPNDGGGGRSGYSPKQMRTAYGVESLCERGFTGKGVTVVVIDSYGSPNLQADFDTFSRQFNLPQLTLDIRAPLGKVNFDYNNSEMASWAVETSLDVETIHAIAPDAKIVVMTSPVDETEGVAGLPEFRQLEQNVVDNHLGTIVSQSFGASEISLDDSAGHNELAQWNTFYQRATTQQGITFVGSSGDGGATDYANATDALAQRLAHVPTTGFPADSPWVLAVGGTTLTINGSSVQETAWQQSGGGFSRFNSEPSYQQQLPSAAQSELNNRRGVPDVAGSADPGVGMPIYFHVSADLAQWQIVGGTSASAPLWAGVLAVGQQMAGHPLGYINPAIYQIGTSSKATADFRDVTSGNNSQPQVGVQGYDAVSGWDPVTGFGTPIAEKLLPDLVAATTSATATPTA